MYLFAFCVIILFIDYHACIMQKGVVYMGCIITVASGKGGVGKTTVSANLAYAISDKGFSVAVIDMDLGLSSLDLALDVSGAVYDITDVSNGTCTADDAFIRLNDGKLFFIPASAFSGYESLNRDSFTDTLRLLRQRFDYIILDAPAGIGTGFHVCAAACDRLYLVATPDACTARDCERTVLAAAQYEIDEIRLILNRIDVKNMKKSISLNIDQMIDTSGIWLLGAIPEDKRIALNASRSTLCVNDKRRSGKMRSKAGAALERIALRATGKRVPLSKFW